MRNVTLLAAAIGAALFTGCSQTSLTVRGQGPVEGQGMPAQSMQGLMHDSTAQQSYMPPGAMPHGMPFDPTGAGGADWNDNGGGEYGPNAQMSGHGPALGQYGFERSYRFKYKEPRDLRYPPAGDSPAVVQYPYYTFKGPDDFFHGGLGRGY